jgi:ribose transport system ATP-binding protein
VLHVCDRITVLRDGCVVTTLDEARTRSSTEKELATLMVGREMSDFFPPRTTPSERVVMSVRHLSVPGHVNDVSFDVRAGEILGFAGLIGAGRTEMAEAIAGLRKKSAGEIKMNVARNTGLRPVPDAPCDERYTVPEVSTSPAQAGGPCYGNTPTTIEPFDEASLQSLKIRSPRDAVAAGIAYLSEDRKGTGLSLDLSIVANTTLVALPRYGTAWISRRREEAATRQHIAALQTKIGRLRDPVRTLSGGNQQKVLLAKWLEIGPRVLMIDEPTRGVDIGAKRQIYDQIHALTARGMACILISSELNEVLGLSHRVAVMRGGKIQAILDAPAATEQSVMFHAAGVAGSV